MKTRDELIYDFMLALAQNPQFFTEEMGDEQCAEAVYQMASRLAFKYLENV